jgi:hypothetical protein
MVKDAPDIKPKDALKPVSIDEEGLVTVEFNGKEYELDVKNIDKIDIPSEDGKITEGSNWEYHEDKTKMGYRDYRIAIGKKLDKFDTKSLYVDDFSLLKWTPGDTDRCDLDTETCDYLLDNLDATDVIQSELLEVIEDAKDVISSDIEVKLILIKPLGLYKDKKGNPGIGRFAKEEALFEITIPYTEKSDIRSIIKVYNSLITRLDNIGEVECKLSQTNKYADNFQVFFEIIVGVK